MRPSFLYFHFSSLLLSTDYFSLRVKSKEGNRKEGEWKETIRTVTKMRGLFSTNSAITLIAFLENQLSESHSCQVFSFLIFIQSNWELEQYCWGFLNYKARQTQLSSSLRSLEIKQKCPTLINLCKTLLMLRLFLKRKQVKFQLSISMTAMWRESLLSDYEFRMIRYTIYIFWCTEL